MNFFATCVEFFFECLVLSDDAGPGPDGKFIGTSERARNSNDETFLVVKRNSLFFLMSKRH